MCLSPPRAKPWSAPISEVFGADAWVSLSGSRTDTQRGGNIDLLVDLSNARPEQAEHLEATASHYAARGTPSPASSCPTCFWRWPHSREPDGNPKPRRAPSLPRDDC